MNRIIIMDPGGDHLSRLARIFWEDGYDLSLVRDESLFWKRMKIVSFDAVIVLTGPGFSEAESFCRRFKEEYGGQGISLILLLSSPVSYSPGLYLQWGASDYLRPPWDKEELLVITKMNIKEREQIHFLMERNYVLEKANQEKDRFFSILSHDLKAPFQGLVGLLEILYGEFDDLKVEEIKGYIRNIHDSTKRTFRVLENLLDWSGFQAGRLRWSPQDLDLRILAEDTVSLFPFCSRDKGVTLVNRVPDNFLVFADQRMIESVMRNLVYNGIKFSHPGGEVIISARESVDYYEVSVDDQGVGISRETLSRIFSRGLTESSPGTAQETGTGMGLQLSMQFIEKHGGQFWIHSEPGEGSSVRFSLPKRQVPLDRCL